MLRRLKEKQEELNEVFESLASESTKGTPIIVEGKKDMKALRALGVEGKIISAKTGGKSLLDIICELEKIKARNVILLLDFDRRGREWTGQLRDYLERTEIKSDVIFWNKLARLVGKEVKDVEGLTTYMETLERKIIYSSS